MKYSLYDLLRSIKMRCLPPSSRSFWNFVNGDFRKVKNAVSSFDYIQTQNCFDANKVTFIPDKEHVRIVFLFQIASFWPNWESFYNACVSDERFEVKVLLLTDVVNETSQIVTARSFLEQNGLDYDDYDETIIYDFRPHVIVVQTPYDFGHRLPEHRTQFFKRHGYRIVYIPYGIEIADTKSAHRAHFNNSVIENSWKVYTFSERMKQDYFFRTTRGIKAIAIGHPKFDSVCRKDQFQLPDEAINQIRGRKVMLWHVHFPKTIVVDSKTVRCTPTLDVYRGYLDYVKQNKDMFFILLPHPKFTETEEGKNFIRLCEELDNILVDWSDDYRYALYAADYMITDRSALMVEIAPTGIPVLYMNNREYDEPLTAAILPIMNSYYHGNCTKDMIEFSDMCKEGKDPKKNERMVAVKENLPPCDGTFGEQIKEDIYTSLVQESK